MTTFTSTAQTLLQQHTDDARRGRVMSLYTITIIGLAPLGALPLGALSDPIGAPRAIFSVAAVVGLAVVALAQRLWQLDEGGHAFQGRRVGQRAPGPRPVHLGPERCPLDLRPSGWIR